MTMVTATLTESHRYRERSPRRTKYEPALPPEGADAETLVALREAMRIRLRETEREAVRGNVVASPARLYNASGVRLPNTVRQVDVEKEVAGPSP